MVVPGWTQIVAPFSSLALLRPDLAVTMKPWPSKKLMPAPLKPSWVSRNRVCVALRVMTSTSPDWRATKRCCAVVGVNFTFSASPNIATAIALQRSTSRPVHLPWLSAKEKPARPVLTAHWT